MDFSRQLDEDGDPGKAGRLTFVYQPLELRFEHRQVPYSNLRTLQLASNQRGHKSRVVGGTVIIYRDGMLRWCFSRLQGRNNILRLLCVSRLSGYFIRFVHTVVAPILLQSLMTSVAQRPRRWVFNRPYPLVQFLESESSVVSSRPQIFRGAIPMYSLPVLSANSTSARPHEGC